MHYSVISAKYLDSYRLELVFKNGRSGVVDFQKCIREGGVFARLADLNFFKQFSINPDFGVVCWGNEVDVAPETLYYAATGIPSAAMVAESPAKYSKPQK